MLSNMETGAGSVEVSARPTLPRTCFHLGHALDDRVLHLDEPLASVMEMLGSVTGM